MLDCAARLPILWLCKSMPFPFDAGDKVYSACLATALAEAGVDVTFLALGPVGKGAADCVNWRPVKGAPRARARALLSRMPLVAARFSPGAMRRALAKELATGRYRVLVIDNYAAGWALDLLPRLSRPAIVYVAHNVESELAASIACAYRGSLINKFLLSRNAAKVARLEARLLDAASLALTLTERDARALRAKSDGLCCAVASPGYSGEIRRLAPMTGARPKAVLMLGSMRWIARKINIERFLAEADAPFFRAGVRLSLAGDVEPDFRSACEARTQATDFCGFLDDLAEGCSKARLGLVLDEVGGGFKLKILDYIFNGLPVAALESALEGVPEAVRAHCLVAGNFGDLVEKIIASIDDLDRLNAMRESSFIAARKYFRWEDRGAQVGRLLGDLALKSCPIGE